MTLPGTRPARRVYPPPIPTSDLPDPGGRTPVERAHRTQQAVAADYTRWRAAHSKDISPDVLKANAGAYGVSNPALALPGVLDAVKADAEGSAKRVNDLIKSNRVGDDVASQLAATRFWAGRRGRLTPRGTARKLLPQPRTWSPPLPPPKYLSWPRN